MEFKSFGKIARYDGLEVVITEKMDGTNACVVIKDGEVGAQSRNRILTVEDDNYGFAQWVQDNREDLLKLGNGYHFGEWCGPKINGNRHKLIENRFYLFNTHKPCEYLPKCCDRVEVLYSGTLCGLFRDYIDVVETVFRNLVFDLEDYYEPEGVVVYFKQFKTRLKFTGEGNKSKYLKGAR